MIPDVGKLVDGDQASFLLAVTEAGSFSAAALKLGVSQPSITQQVQRLERLAGRKLFRRTQRGVELTREGEAVIVYARAMLTLSEDLRRQLESTSGSVRVSLGFSEDFLRTALPSVLGLLMRDYPQLEVTVLSGHYETLRSAIERKAVDLAVLRRYRAFPEATTLWSDELVWNGRPDLVLPVADPVPLVLPIAPNPARDVPLETLRAAGRTWRIRFESVGIAGIEAALQAGIGICAGPRNLPLHGAAPLGEGHGLPKLPNVEFMMVGADGAASGPQRTLAEIIRQVTSSDFAVPGTLP